MGTDTKIEWADHTFNPWLGCTKVSPACDHCYAEARMDKRLHVVQWGPGQPRKRTSEANWRLPIKWNAEAERTGTRPRVFCASLADVFDNEVDPQWRAELLNLIADTPNLDWLLLTKRIGNARRMLDAYCASDGNIDQCWDGAWPNVWLGATICNQEEADRDIHKLLATPAAKRFLSIEPMLGPVDLTGLPLGDTCASECCGNARLDALNGASYCGDTQRDPATEIDEADSRIDWIIAGGESGPGARPMHPDWVRSLRDQCVDAGVPFFFKQWGEWREPVESEEFSTAMGRAQAVPAFIVANDGTVHCFENDKTGGGHPMLRVGKKAAGRMLDGREWNEVPA